MGFTGVLLSPDHVQTHVWTSHFFYILNKTWEIPLNDESSSQFISFKHLWPQIKLQMAQLALVVQLWHVTHCDGLPPTPHPRPGVWNTASLSGGHGEMWKAAVSLPHGLAVLAPVFRLAGHESVSQKAEPGFQRSSTGLCRSDAKYLSVAVTPDPVTAEQSTVSIVQKIISPCGRIVAVWLVDNHF